MAQQDTGLGWSAESNYLIATAPATLGGFTEISGGYGPLPTNCTTWAQTIAEGDVQYTHYRDGRVTYWGSFDEKTIVTAVVDTSGEPTMYFFSPEQHAYRVTATYPGSDFISKLELGNYDSSTGLYYLGLTYNPVVWIMNPSVPHFSTLADALAAISVSSTVITKTNQNYAVCANARWKTSNNTIITTPVLISSDSQAVEMDNITGYNYAKSSYLLGGVRFYMGFFDIVNKDVSSPFPLFDKSDSADPSLSLEDVFRFVASVDYAHITIHHAPDPYEEEGAGSGEEGGDGEDLEDDEMGISHHAIPAAINTGFCRIYCPTEQQLRDLSNFLWSAQFDITAVKKLFANPMDSVLGLSAVPLTLSGANMPVYLGGVETEMSFPMVSYQSYQVPMGAITVEKRWGSYLDYDPYTRFSIFLPFIGFKDLSADDIMGKQIILDYDVDILSGACTARLQAGGNVLYQWSGQCSIQLPVTASNWNQVFQGATSAALSAGLAVATGSAGPVLAGALAAEGAQAIMGKPRIERGGTASGAAGWMGGLTPYLVRVTPEAIIPSDQNKFIGYPAFSSISLGDLTGYNEISSIHLEGIPATGAELEELEAILKGGVIF